MISTHAIQQTARSLLGALVICLVAVLCSCSGDDGNNKVTPQSDAGDDMAMMQADAADSGGDDEPSGTNATTGEFEPGWNDVSQNTPDSFTPLADGEEIPFVFGVQGSWMVVLGFRTHDMFEDPFDIQAEIEIEGETAGDIWWEAQETFPGGDGWDYYYNLFLPIDGEPPAQGTPVHVVMRILDADENTIVEREHDLLAGEADGP